MGQNEQQRCSVFVNNGILAIRWAGIRFRCKLAQIKSNRKNLLEKTPRKKKSPSKIVKKKTFGYLFV